MSPVSVIRRGAVEPGRRAAGIGMPRVGAVLLLLWLLALPRSGGAQAVGNDTAPELSVNPSSGACERGPTGVAAGCPCDPDPCASGLYCSDAMNALLPNQTIIAGEGRGLCLPCSPGDFCPQGTTVLQPADMSSVLDDFSLLKNPNGGERSRRLEEASKLLCSSGSYCPTPKEAIPCDPGYFCPQGSIRQETCSIPRLLLDDPTVRFRFVETRVMVQELREGEQIIQGNICPAGSASASTQCPAGSFCPSVDVTEPCPRGYYCPAASTSPHKCPWLSSCPPGSESTGYSWGGFVIGAAIIVVLAAIIILISILSRGEASEVETHVKVQERLYGLIAALDVPQSKFPTFKQQQRITIEFTDLRLTIKKGVTILNGITGKFDHSHMVAIMGGSGCGKTTFLNVLCGKASYGRQSGKVRINTHEVPLQLIRSIKGFVPQDDTVHEDLTVQENLHFSASVRLPDSFDHKKRLSVVRDTCELLQLLHIMNSVVGSVEKRGISGGQRKRVNIGVELVAQPSILFLDEPTSGLDSTSSQAVLNGLKLLSHRGMSSIMVIHQPRYTIFELFDQVLLLAAGGNQVFLGPSSLVLPYFESKGFSLPPKENPAHFFLDVIHEKVECATDPDFNVEKLFDMWKESGEEWVAQNTESPTRTDTIARHSRTSRRARAAMKRVLNTKFSEMDNDDNGFLTPVEMREFVIALGHECEMGDAQEIITIMTDGRSYQEVTREEFVNYCLDQDFFSGLLSQMATRTMRRTASLNVDNSLPPDFSMASVDGSSKVFQNPIPEVLAAQPAATSQQMQPFVSPTMIPLDSMELPDGGESFELPQARSLRNPLRQFIIVFHRSAKKYQRSWITRIVDIVTVSAVALIIGGIQGTNWTLTRAGVNFILYLLALGVLVTTGTLRVFGKVKVVHWREAASGYNVLSAYLGMMAFDLLDVTLRPLLFSTVYWSLTASSVEWSYMFAVSWMCAWYCSGMAYILSTILPDDNMTLAGAAIPLVMAGFLNGYNPTLRSFGAYSPMHYLTYVSYARWGVEMLMVAYFSNSDIQFRLPALALMQNIGFCNYVFHEDPGSDVPAALNTTTEPSMSQIDASSDLVVAYAMETFPELYEEKQVSVAEAMEEFGARCRELAQQNVQDRSCNELLAFYKETTGYQQCWHAAHQGFIALAVMGLILRIIAYLTLKYTNRGKQI